ncbi:MAG: glycosyltransferase [Clostridia bacterium]|nr:glycosyltransferase [Clostridia bacterium]
MPLVSVIIPVHNAELFLEECIASLQKQTITDTELIFVDDASTDASGELLLTAKNSDPRIEVITFLENRGVSAARNAGIDRASGRYIAFCDADDWYEPEMLEALVGACERDQSDVSFCRVFKDRENEQINVPLGFEDGRVFESGAILDELIPAMLALPKDGDGQPLSGYTPRNLFRRSVIGTIRFREDIHYAEDLLFIITCYLNCRRITVVDRAYYHYRFYKGSVTKRYSKYIPDSLERSNEALTELLSGSPLCMERMRIRKRKMSVDAVRNICTNQTPYSFPERIRWIKEYMGRADIRALYHGLRLRKIAPRTAIRLGLMKYRCAFLSCLLYSTLFKNWA